MNDEEIKKALECCPNGQCEDCPFYTRCFNHMVNGWKSSATYTITLNC